jgi:hypothetical protein
MSRIARISVTACRKVGEPNYGSRGAEVSLEIEIPANEQADPQTIIARAFAQVTKAVDDQLARAERVPQKAAEAPSPAAPPTPAAPAPSSPAPPASSAPPSPPPSSNGTATQATEKQARAIFALGKLKGINVKEKCNPHKLTIADASKWIDWLRAQPDAQPEAVTT